MAGRNVPKGRTRFDYRLLLRTGRREAEFSPGDLLTLAEVFTITGLNPVAVEAAIGAGRLKAIELLPNGSVGPLLVPIEDLIRFLGEIDAEACRALGQEPSFEVQEVPA